MKQLLWGITCLLFVQSSLAQKSPHEERQDTTIYYFNSAWEPLPVEVKSAATYYRKAWKLNEDLFYIFDYYRDGRVQMKATGRSHDPLYSEGYVSGRIRYTHSGDTLDYIKYNNESKLDGDARYSYDDGSLKSIGNFRDDERHSHWKFFYENGQLEEEGDYVNGNLDGDWIGYHENGQVRYKGTYKDGKRDGTWLNFLDNGQLREELTYSAGARVGQSERLHANGKVAAIENYVNGDREGEWKEYYENGQLVVEKTYKEGKLHGLYTAYYDDGELNVKAEYNEGDALYRYAYTHDGTPLSSQEYKDGALHGECFENWPSGKPKHVQRYKKGELVSEQWYDELGAKMTPAQMKTGPQLKDSDQPRRLIVEALKPLGNAWMRDRVVLHFDIDKQGNTTNTSVVETANDVLDTALMHAIGSIEWTPGTKDDKPSSFGNEMVIYLDFSTVDGVTFGKPYGVKDEEVGKGEEEKSTKSYGGIFHIVEEMPQYPGNAEGMFKFLGSETRYPGIAKDQGITGVVYVQFTVLKSGVVANPTILRGVHPLLDMEAMRVVKAMPLWEPGKQRGTEVDVFYKLPFRFTLK